MWGLLRPLLDPPGPLLVATEYASSATLFIL